MVPVILMIAVFAGCGGGGGTAPDGAGKERIQTAALTLSGECIGGQPDPIAVEKQVDVLVDAADQAGDSEFTLGKFHGMRDVLSHEANMMRDNECAPDQEKRLRDASP